MRTKTFIHAGVTMYEYNIDRTDCQYTLTLSDLLNPKGAGLYIWNVGLPWLQTFQKDLEVILKCKIKNLKLENYGNGHGDLVFEIINSDEGVQDV